ncbi:MAG TPA: hypothetical protein VHE37_13950, partial [Nevskiaceae bacterium]|nr:hypothetical protein [Nevskiaceae bacterium]
SVMMPFAPALRPVYEELVRACAELGLQCRRADDIWDESEVIQDVFSLIWRSAVVICDFSERNSNVFYETGIAHTLGKPVIPILQQRGDAPFDLKHHRYIEYRNSASGRAALARKVGERLRTLLK